MGRSSGPEYNSLSENDNDDGVGDHLNTNSATRQFSAVSLEDDEDDMQIATDTQLHLEDRESLQSEDVLDYWSEQKGISRLLAVVVRFVCTGSGLRAFLVLVSSVVIGIALFVVALLLYPIKLETSLSSFQIPDNKVYIREDALEAAAGLVLSAHNSQFTGGSSRKRRSLPAGSYVNSVPRERINERWKVNLVYRTRDGSNILQKDHIERIRSMERKIEAHAQYTEFCWLDWRHGSLAGHTYPSLLSDCVPINSLMTYFYPPDGRQEMALNGDVMAVVRNAWSSPDFFWYLDSTFSESNPFSKLMRSQIILGTPLHGDRSPDQQHTAAKKYIVGLIPLLASLSDDKIQVLYGSPDIYDYQVESAAYADVRLSIISVVLIALFVFILTSFSSFLTCICVEAVAMSLPLAYSIYRIPLGVDSFGLLNILSLFVITGIGVDDGFMFINTFRQAPHWTHHDLPVRIHYTLHTAGKATLFTSATTAAAFFANLASGIPAVHNFGLFMGLVVVMCYTTVSIQMPLALYLWQLHSCCRTCCCSDSKCSCTAGGDSGDGDDQSHTSDNVELIGMRQIGNGTHTNRGTTNGGNGISVGTSSAPDVAVDVLASRRSSGSMSGSCGAKRSSWLTDMMSRLIRDYIAKPVTKYRTPIVVGFVILFSVSIGLVTRLRTADKPPQFFPSSSNLQQFIDLGYNTSQMNIDCSYCSGYYHPPKPASTTTHTGSTASTATVSTAAQQPATAAQQPATPAIPSAATTNSPAASSLPVATGPTTTAPPSMTFPEKTTTPPTVATQRPPTTPRRIPTTQSTYPPDDPAPRPTVAPNSQEPATQTHAPVVDHCAADPAKCKAAPPPSLVSTANVYIVFGIKSIIRKTSSGHVLKTSKDVAVYDDNFNKALSSVELVRAMCKICLAAIEPHRDLVAQSSGAYECLPPALADYVPLLLSVAECHDPRLSKPGAAVHAQSNKASSVADLTWVAFGFKSNAYKGGSSFTARNDFNKWEDFMEEVHRNYSSIPAIQTTYQTSEYWKEIFLEVVAVTSALYSIALSAFLCLVFVAIFTGCPLLTLVTISTVGCIACAVLAVFYMLGWHLGAVEAISMSILIGTAVDYCVHLVEGYLLARRHLKLPPVSRDQRFIQRIRANISQSCQRARWSLSHVGLSIVSSALTTLFASLPLCFAQIQLLARFGQIMFINTLTSIILTATACCALLCFQPQWRFPGTWKATIGGLFASGAFCGFMFLVLYLVHTVNDISIPAPDGSNLF